MEKDINYSLLTAVFDNNRASEVLAHMLDKGLAKEGTIFNGKGSLRSSVLEYLKINHKKKEVLIMPIDKDDELDIFTELEDEFLMGRGKQGIAFTADLFSSSQGIGEKREDSMVTSDFEAVFIVVEKGEAEEVIDNAQKLGARGATIIKGRGSSANTSQKALDLTKSDPKDIVLMLLDKEKVDDILDGLKQRMNFGNGKDYIFTMPVNRTIGIIK